MTQSTAHLIRRTCVQLAYVLGLGGSAEAMAVPAFTPVADIAHAAESVLGGNGAQVHAAVDTALRMPLCTQPLQAVATSPKMAEVRCPDAAGWRLTVPARVRREADVVVLLTAAPMGQPFAAAQLTVQRRDVGAGGALGLPDPAQVAGHIARRALPAGAVVSASDLADATGTLKRGDPVVIVSRFGGIEVRMGGRALGAAMSGAIVAVENTASRRIIRGRLIGEGVVEVIQ